MIDTPQIVQTAAQSTAVIRITIPRAEIRKVMGPASPATVARTIYHGPYEGLPSAWREFDG